MNIVHEIIITFANHKCSPHGSNTTCRAIGNETYVLLLLSDKRVDDISLAYTTLEPLHKTVHHQTVSGIRRFEGGSVKRSSQTKCIVKHRYSNTDGSFTMDNSNSFLNPYEVLSTAQENKYLGKFSKLYVLCTH